MKQNANDSFQREMMTQNAPKVRLFNAEGGRLYRGIADGNKLLK